MIITIDGPVASGKSTLARMLAKDIGAYYIYSGLLYRALAYLLIEHEAYQKEDLENPKAEDLARYLDADKFVYSFEDDFKERIFFENQDITPFLKTNFIDDASSIISTNGRVREALYGIIREIARHFDIVFDGRDGGSVVFPAADFKFYVTAPVEVRAERWRNDQRKEGFDFSSEQALQKVGERDRRDKERKIAPLVIPDGAIIVDTAGLTPEENLQKMFVYIQNNQLLQEK